MKHAFLAAAAATFLALPATAQSGPSFNCGGALNPVEQAICRDPDLAILDREIAALYQAAQLGPDMDAGRQSELTARQRGWIASRDGCTSAPELSACVTAVYGQRIYELKTDAAFGRADFFSLWDGESATLGADLVARDELQLRPGETRTLQRTLQPDTREIGVVAAFRDLERAQWRAPHVVVPNQTQAVTIQLEARAVRILPAATR